ncbi:MAG: HEAT repeat domain-containing protein [Planctomycetes bacterium]|nr:HEAT repeat domain-containing protein [Planctomycetota bacterium]
MTPCRLTLPFLLLLLAACTATSSGPRGEPAPDEAERERQLREADGERRNLLAVLVKLDQSMESYSRALFASSARSESDATRLYRLIRENVLDIGTQARRPGEAERAPGHNFVLLQSLAVDEREPAQRAIAVAALGFSGRPEVMPLLAQATQASDPVLVDRAVFGLAVLRAPATPPGLLAAVLADAKRTEASRTQAAWALYHLQDISERRPEIVAIWRNCLTEGAATLPAGVVVQAIRGLGADRDAQHIALVAKFLKHPVPKVREATAVALGRLNAQQHVDDLLAMISPAETVPNVRLAAQKALSALSGGEDHGYDIAEWRKTFDRGR